VDSRPDYGASRRLRRDRSRVTGGCVRGCSGDRFDGPLALGNLLEPLARRSVGFAWIEEHVKLDGMGQAAEGGLCDVDLPGRERDRI
jgi:hypothetical protein